MKFLDKNTTGFIFGSLAGLAHLFWSALVGAGLAQQFLDFIYSIHFLNNPFTVSGFDIVKAITLVVVTFACGYIGGFVFAIIWNMMVVKK